MMLEDLRYSLLPENLQGTPREIRLGRRDLAKLLIVERESGKWEQSLMMNLPDVILPGDVFVLNNSKRIPGVLKGRTKLQGQVEFRFVDLEENGSGLCRIFPMHDISPGKCVSLQKGGSIRVEEVGLTKYGLARVRSDCNANLRQLLREQGTPILGFFYDGHWNTDQLNPYYATVEGGVESPLAGLHFTPELVRRLKDRGVKVCFITLHSVGSWLPFLEENVGDHRMWSEFYDIPFETAETINRARDCGHRVFACGSTSLRALETAAVAGRKVDRKSGRTDLYITPGYNFQVVDGYFTNFHQYQTSLMVLDAAFCGSEFLRQVYKEASKSHYAFYEFGDAVLYL